MAGYCRIDTTKRGKPVYAVAFGLPLNNFFRVFRFFRSSLIDHEKKEESFLISLRTLR